MPKILDAECLGEVVTADGKLVGDAVILSEGKGPSDGVLLIDEERVTYITSNAEDIKTLITNLGLLIDQIAIVLGTLDGTSTAPGSATAGILALTILKTQVMLTKELLK